MLSKSLDFKEIELFHKLQTNYCQAASELQNVIKHQPEQSFDDQQKPQFYDSKKLNAHLNTISKLRDKKIQLGKAMRSVKRQNYSRVDASCFSPATKERIETFALQIPKRKKAVNKSVHLKTLKSKNKEYSKGNTYNSTYQNSVLKSL